MKRLLGFLLSLAIVFCLLPAAVSAAEVGSGTCGENVTWVLTEDGTLTISGTGPMKDYSNWSISNFAPWYGDKILRIVIEEGVTYIGVSAFNSCDEATSVTIPDTVTKIGHGAFDACKSLTDVTLPEGIVSIDSSTFNTCYSLTSVTLPDSVERIEKLAFGLCRALTSITIPKNVKSLESWAFGDCVALTEIMFEGDAPSIWNDSFRNVTANAYYPAGNDTWTDEVRQDYGGNLTWIPYEPEITAVPGDVDGSGVVDDSDVAQLLWHSLFPNDYAVSGDADFNADGAVDDRDVAYLLWHTLFPENYPL